MTGPYNDILDLPHPVSKNHPPMPMADRAAQFAPFAALTGFEAALLETERLTDHQIQLDEDEIASVNEVLQHLHSTIAQQPTAAVTYFVPDEKKTGGAYVTIEGTVKKVDDIQKILLFMDGTRVPLSNILSIAVT
jgi:hypothetical protein